MKNKKSAERDFEEFERIFLPFKENIVKQILEFEKENYCKLIIKDCLPSQKDPNFDIIACLKDI